jgi:Ca2+-transporting ATPase
VSAPEQVTHFHALPPAHALRALQSDPRGLSEADARERLGIVGPNELRVARPVSAWRILLAQLRSVVVMLLVAAAVVSLVAGDWLDAAAIAAVLLLNTLLGFVTELRARRAMQALLALDVPQAVVVRDGRAREIPARTIVPGDVIRVEAGQSVAADARLLDAVELKMNEASLTGESFPVRKTADPQPEDVPLADRVSMLYKGTVAVAGTGRAVVVATGMATELGRIGALVGGIEEERTPLERRLDVLGRRLVWLALAIAALVVALGALQGLPLSDLVQTGIALAIAAVPEALPAVSTIALAVGVHRMAKRNALVRRLPSVETLGSVTSICTDKTGTLTAGQMTATTLWIAGRQLAVSGVGYAPEGALTDDGSPIASSDQAITLALRIAVLANRAEIERGEEGWVARGDPTEAALVTLARKAGVDRERLRAEWPEIGEVPFSSERMLMATFHHAPDGGSVAFVKGAPIRVLEHCGRALASDGERELDAPLRGQLRERNRELARKGLRVLALAHARVTRPDADALRGLTFVGYVGMMDPPATGVRETIRAFSGAGIRTVMLTGDQKLTAEAIARELGILRPDDEVMDGRELAALSESELAARVGRISAFSRVSPEQKLTIISAFQTHGEIVAMLGDGVNDAAALKKADVGVAMGVRGTDVAKEAAAVVLRDDRFQTVGAAVEEGRVIFDNIRKFVFYLFSCNLAEILLLLAASAFGYPLPLLPLQILWLNLATDTFPALALAVEPAEPNVMRRPPRDPQQAILSARFMASVALYGALIAGASFAAFLWGLSETSNGNARAVTLAFTTLALAQTFHLGNARQRGPVLSGRRIAANRHALGAVAIVAVLQTAAIHFAPLAGVLATEPLSVRDWLVVLALSAFPAAIGQTIKLVEARLACHRNPCANPAQR